MVRLTWILVCAMLIVVSFGIPTVTRAQGDTRLTCRIDPSTLALNGQATLVLEIANIQNLYGYELIITYETERVQILDADTGKGGINLQLVNAFISPDFVVLNSVDNGQIRLALTQLAPNGPKSGSGELARATITGISAGFANFAFGNVTFSDNNGQVIGVQKQDCLIEIGNSGQPTPTHTPAPTQTPTSTPVPTQTSTSVSQPPTSTFTPQAATATFTPLPPTSTAVPTASAVSSSSETAALPTGTPTLTPTVFVVTTPTPAQPPVVSVDTRAQPAQSPQATAESMSATAAAPASTPVPSTDANALGTLTPMSAAASSQSPMLASGQEVLSPPEIESASDETSASNDLQSVAISSTINAPTVEPSPTATLTPLVIAQVVPSAPLPVEVLQQPESSPSPVRRLPQGLGWLLLLLMPVLVVVVWRLRKA